MSIIENHPEYEKNKKDIEAYLAETRLTRIAQHGMDKGYYYVEQDFGAPEDMGIDLNTMIENGEITPARDCYRWFDPHK